MQLVSALMAKQPVRFADRLISVIHKRMDERNSDP